MPEVLFSYSHYNSPRGQSIVERDRFQQVINCELNRGIGDLIDSIDEQDWTTAARKLAGRAGRSDNTPKT